MRLSNCLFSGNYARSRGGAINDDAEHDLEISSVRLYRQLRGRHPAMAERFALINGWVITLTDCRFEGNTAAVDMGGAC